MFECNLIVFANSFSWPATPWMANSHAFLRLLYSYEFHIVLQSLSAFEKKTKLLYWLEFPELGILIEALSMKLLNLNNPNDEQQVVDRHRCRQTNGCDLHFNSVKTRAKKRN